MDDFRIKRKINDSDIENFKNSQINRILSNTKPKATYSKRKLRLALSFSLLGLLFLSIGITIFTTRDNKNLNIQQVSAQEYILEFKDTKDEFAKAEAKALKVRATATKVGGQYDKIIASSQKVLDKAEKAANDLGVAPSSIKGFNSLEDLAVDLDDKRDDIENFDFNLGQ
jgi:hypothetical protein